MLKIYRIYYLTSHERYTPYGISATLDVKAAHPDLARSNADAYRAAERDSSVQLAARLQEVCKEALSATRTGQSFGDMKVEGRRAYQGIVGTAQNGVEQSFRALTATGASTAAQGQMDANSFTLMFGNPETPRNPN
jgi:hypothetical protein